MFTRQRRRFWFWLTHKERGAIIVEYELLTLLIALVAVVAVALFGVIVSSMYTQVVLKWP